MAMPKPNTTATIQLDRHDEPRTVRVVSVNATDETAMIEYPNTTSRVPLFTDLREEVSWDDFTDE